MTARSGKLARWLLGIPCIMATKQTDSAETDKAVSAKINAIRQTAQCPTCCQSAGAPYRWYVESECIEGCIDAFHSGKLRGVSLAWHMRPCAVKWRKDVLQRLTDRSRNVA